MATAGQLGLTCVKDTDRVIYVLDDDSDDDDGSSCSSSDRRKPQCSMSGRETWRMSDFDYHYEPKEWNEKSMVLLQNLVIEEATVQLGLAQSGHVLEIATERILAEFDSRNGDHYHRLLELRLGPMDRNSPGYKDLYANFRDVRMSMYSRGIEAVNSVLRTQWDLEDKLDEIYHMFSVEAVDYDSHQRRQSPKMKDGSNCPYWTPPRINSSTCTPAAPIPKEPERLLTDVTNMVAAYPLGVGYGVLMKDCVRRLGEKATSKIKDLLFQEKKIFHVIDATPEKLVYLGCLSEVTSMDFFMKSIFHYVHLVILSRKQITGKDDGVSVATIGMDLSKSFGIPLNPCDWGWPDEVTFYRYLVQQWGFWDVEIIAGDQLTESRLKLLDEAKRKQLLQPVVSDHSRRSDRLNRLDESTSRHLSQPVVSDHLRRRDRLSAGRFSSRPDIPTLSDVLHKESSYLMTVIQVVRMDKMVVKPADNDSLEPFIEAMTSAYNRFEKNRTSDHTLSDKTVRIGSYVAYWRHKQWLRAQVISCSTNEKYVDRKYYVLFLIDIGRVVRQVKASAMRLIHKEFASYPQQTVHCEMNIELVPEATSEKEREDVDGWEVTKQLRLLLKSKKIRITPVERLNNDSRTWKVKIGLVSNEGGLLVRDVGYEAERVNSL